MTDIENQEQEQEGETPTDNRLLEEVKRKNDEGREDYIRQLENEIKNRDEIISDYQEKEEKHKVTQSKEVIQLKKDIPIGLKDLEKRYDMDLEHEYWSSRGKSDDVEVLREDLRIIKERGSEWCKTDKTMR